MFRAQTCALTLILSVGGAQHAFSNVLCDFATGFRQYRYDFDKLKGEKISDGRWRSNLGLAGFICVVDQPFEEFQQLRCVSQKVKGGNDSLSAKARYESLSAEFKKCSSAWDLNPSKDPSVQSVGYISRFFGSFIITVRQEFDDLSDENDTEEVSDTEAPDISSAESTDLFDWHVSISALKESGGFIKVAPAPSTQLSDVPEADLCRAVTELRRTAGDFSSLRGKMKQQAVWESNVGLPGFTCEMRTSKKGDLSWNCSQPAGKENRDNKFLSLDASIRRCGEFQVEEEPSLTDWRSYVYVDSAGERMRLSLENSMALVGDEFVQGWALWLRAVEQQ